MNPALQDPPPVDRNGGSPQAGEDAFERLNRASVGLLDPLLEPGNEAEPQRTAARLGDAISHCAQVAEDLGLHGLGRLATLMLPYLQREAGGADWPAARERVEGWIGQVIAFCAGQLEAGGAAQLLDGPRQWPGFPTAAEPFTETIVASLAEDAERIAALAARALEGELPAAMPGSVAEDELAMLRDAVDGFGDEIVAPLAGLRLPVDEAGAPRLADLADLCRERLGNLADALRYVGLVPLAGLIEPCRESLAGWRDHPQSAGAELPGLLGGLVDGVSAFLREPGEAGLARLAAAAGDPRWPRRADDAPALLDALRGLQVVRSRQVTAAAPALGPDDMSLQIPADADRSVVDNLLRELPLLSAELCDRVERLVAGVPGAAGAGHAGVGIGAGVGAGVHNQAFNATDAGGRSVADASAPDMVGPAARENLAAAQRIAHTLKGAANTVGVRGIANLTHRLEDLLELLGRQEAVPDAQAARALGDAADCLAEMSEAVAGLGSGPVDALVVCAGLDAAILAQLSGGDRQAPPGAGLLVPSPAASEGPSPAHGGSSSASGEVPAAFEQPPAAFEQSSATAGQLPAAFEQSPATAGQLPATSAKFHSTSTQLSAISGKSPVTSGELSVTPAEPPAATPWFFPAADHGAGMPAPPPQTPLPARPPEAVPPAAPAAGADPRAGDQLLHLPARLVDRMLELAGEATILLAQVQEQVARLGDVRHAFRVDADRLRDLAGELDRLVEIRGVSLGGRRGREDFDPLELDDFDELHTVSRRIGEAGADARILDQQLDRQGAALSEIVGQLERVQTDLRETLMQSRTVPVHSMAGRLQRVVRQAARMTGKPVQLTIAGEDTAVDSQLLHALMEPLGHLLRNAVDHGIEPPQVRERAGKPAMGRVLLEFRRDGHRLSIRCVDDGRGLDLEAIRAQALRNGLLGPDEPLPPAALARLILRPGFTTREQAGHLSGRGIGMDVVARAVRELHGEIVLLPEPGQGLEVRLELPEGMAAIPVVLARTPSHVLALSIRGVERILPIAGALHEGDDGLRFAAADEGLLPARRLDEMIGLPAGFFLREAEAARLSAGRSVAARWGGDGEVALLVRRGDGALVAVIAPGLGQTRAVVVRPLPSWLPPIPAVEGAAVLGDGAVAAVLDLPRLAERDAPLAAAAFAERPVAQQPVCLVADDSVSVRRSMEIFLKDLGFEVDAAGDGVDALALIRRRLPALAIVDLEMPRMNGVELCRALRADPRTRGLPVIMITSRASEKHRALAREAGVDVFLTKPYSEDDLAAEIHRCLVARQPLG